MSNEQKKTVKVKLVKSPSRTAGGHRDTVLGLGLKRMNQVRELEHAGCAWHDHQGGIPGQGGGLICD